MKCLSFIFKNIKNFFLRHTVMFFFLIIVQIVCCTSVFIVCGMANNMYYVEDTGKTGTSDNSNEREFGFGVGEEVLFSMTSTENESYYIVDGKRVDYLDYSGSPTVSEIRPLLEKAALAIGDDFGFINLYMVSGSKIYSKDIGILPINIVSVFPGNETTNLGEAFEHSSENIFTGGNRNEGDTLTINGIEYKYIFIDRQHCTIPYNALQDDFRVFGVSVVITEIPTAQRLEELTNIICSIFGDIRLDEVPETYEPLERQISQMVYVISIIIMIIILLALAKLYSYILSNRQKTLTVLRLCGGTKRQIHFIYMIEIFLTMIVTSALGYVLFRYVFYEPIASMYPSFEVFFTPDIYITILAAYIVLALIIMAITIIPATKASIIDMKRG